MSCALYISAGCKKVIQFSLILYAFETIRSEKQIMQNNYSFTKYERANLYIQGRYDAINTALLAYFFHKSGNFTHPRIFKSNVCTNYAYLGFEYHF